MHLWKHVLSRRAGSQHRAPPGSLTGCWLGGRGPQGGRWWTLPSGLPQPFPVRPASGEREAGRLRAAGRGPRQPRLCRAPLCSRAARVTCRAAEAAHSSSSPHVEPSKLQEAAPKLEGESSAGSPLSAVVTGSPVQQSGRSRTSSRERASEPHSDGGGRRSPRPLAG